MKVMASFFNMTERLPPFRSNRNSHYISSITTMRTTTHPVRIENTEHHDFYGGVTFSMVEP